MPAAQQARPLEVVPDTSPATAAPSTATPSASGGEAVLVDVVVLTGDLELFGSTREAVGERNPVWRARSADEAADLLITGRCGVLLIDLACVSTRADTFIEQIVEQFPDVVVCVAGTREDEPILAGLISDGLVYRFMHKPATARRAGMFLQAAIRRHVERRDDGGLPDVVLPLLRSLPRPRIGLPRRYLGLLAVCALALTVPLFVGGGPEVPTDAREAALPVPADTLSGDAGRRGDGERADPVLSRARAALQAGRLEAPEGRNALDLFEAVLLAQPDHPEARAGLARTVALLIERAEREAAGGHKAEAERLLQRVLAVDPQHGRAKTLLTRINPPDTPSRQLVREQMAEARAADPPALLLASASVDRVTSKPRVEPPVARPSAEVPVPVTNLAASTSAKRAAVVQPDPLAPRYANTPARTGTLSRPRVFGGEVANALPIAGTNAGAAGADIATPVDAAATAELLRVPADELERISARDPVYPVAALRSGTRGWVELEFTITPAGAVRDIQVVGAEPGGVFENAATDALAQWRFRPRVVNGQTVAQRSTVTIRFDLDGCGAACRA
jgi:TonB family protein